ncbi:MAG: hypothetical protein IKV59_07715 [Lachnospiraceae bacterium]|nr:hypothetical protein [Lachnospiraceae bacterium]
MNRKIRILLCSILLGFSLTACLILPGDSDSCADTGLSAEECQEAVRTVAWWSTMYERPNPERLPVSIRFHWLKGLE